MARDWTVEATPAAAAAAAVVTTAKTAAGWCRVARLMAGTPLPLTTSTSCGVRDLGRLRNGRDRAASSRNTLSTCDAPKQRAYNNGARRRLLNLSGSRTRWQRLYNGLRYRSERLARLPRPLWRGFDRTTRFSKRPVLALTFFSFKFINHVKLFKTAGPATVNVFENVTLGNV